MSLNHLQAQLQLISSNLNMGDLNGVNNALTNALDIIRAMQLESQSPPKTPHIVIFRAHCNAPTITSAEFNSLESAKAAVKSWEDYGSQHRAWLFER